MVKYRKNIKKHIIMTGNKFKNEMLKNAVSKILMDRSKFKHVMIFGTENYPENRWVLILPQDAKSTVAWSKKPTFAMIPMMVHWSHHQIILMGRESSVIVYFRQNWIKQHLIIISNFQNRQIQKRHHANQSNMIVVSLIDNAFIKIRRMTVSLKVSRHPMTDRQMASRQF